MFHANEIAKLDGKTVGPWSFAGPIGKLLASCENKAIVNFEPTYNFNLKIGPSDLITYQMQSYEILSLLSSGTAPESLEKRHPAVK